MVSLSLSLSPNRIDLLFPSPVVHPLCFSVMYYLASITCSIVQWEYFMVLIVFSHVADIINSNLEKNKKLSELSHGLMKNCYLMDIDTRSDFFTELFRLFNCTRHRIFMQVPPANITPHNHDLDGYCFGAGVRYQVNYTNGQVASVSLMGIYARAPKTTYRLSICSRRIGCAWLGGETL